MKKTQIFIIILLLILPFATNSVKSIAISPAEIKISMKNGNFTNGNTSRKITIKNDYNHTHNVTWYIEHPSPDLMRPNKTNIFDLSWVDLEPKWLEIPAKEIGFFYVHLDIPETGENCNKSWETWITFRGGKQNTSVGVFNYEYSIRTYINTPLTLPPSAEDEINIPLLEIAILSIAAIVLIAVIIIFKKNKKT
jgi:hypothetical protein